MSSRNLILCVHGRTSRAEIEAAFGILTGDAPWIHREGVLWHEPSQTDLLFITLNKSEALFSPSTRTRDLALGPSVFHCESQEGEGGDIGGVDAGDGVGGLREGMRQERAPGHLHAAATFRCT